MGSNYRNEGDLPIQCAEISTSFSSIPYRPYSESMLQYSRRSPLSISRFSHIDPRFLIREVRPHLEPSPIHPPQMLNGIRPSDEREPRQHVTKGGTSTRQAVATVAGIFIVSLLALLYIYMKFPELEEEERQHIKLPWDIEDAKQLGRVLDRYKDLYFFEVLSAIFVTYIFLQTFAIPGSISLSILSGFLFPFPLALVLVCFCSATGASLCYILSFFLGRRVVYKYFPQKASEWAATVNKHRSNLLNYILFLRMTPFLPNWFINIAAPVIDVPLFPFWLGTFIGVAPPSFVAIQAGQTLYKLSASSDTWSWTSVILLGAFALLSLVPVLLKQRLRDKFE